MLLEPCGCHIRETVIAEIAAVCDAEPAIVQLLAGDQPQGSPVGLVFLVDGDRGGLDPLRFMEPELEPLRDATAAGLPLRYDLDRYLSSVRLERETLALSLLS